MKKLLSVILALVMILSLSTVAFADAVTDPSTPTAPETFEDVETVKLYKEYKLENNGTKSPAETFEFENLECIGVTDAAEGVSVATAPVPTAISTVVYAEGEAGSTTAKKTITVTLPTYTSVGVYTYTFNEKNNNVAGVTYFDGTITLKVTVIEQDGKIRVAAVHTESPVSTGAGKKDTFENKYSAGSLSINKVVTGNMGDQSKEFTVKVTFTAPQGKTVNSDITYNKGTETVHIEKGWTDSVTKEITLKHNGTVTFENIPYGVTYTVEENDYSGEGYKVSYDGNVNGEIKGASVATVITNNKTSEVDTGVALDSLPYVLLLAVACVGMAVVLTKKRRED